MNCDGCVYQYFDSPEIQTCLIDGEIIDNQSRCILYTRDKEAKIIG